MSADSTTVCPNCNPELLTYTDHDGIVDFAAEDMGIERSLREYYEFTLRNVEIDGVRKMVLVIDYEASCRECGWEFSVDSKNPIPNLDPPK
jgi:hypothetical protein